MSLVEIKNYLMQVRIANLATLCAYFKCDAELLRSMMLHWTRKGKVRCFMQNPACGKTCMSCDKGRIELYEWVYLN